jgi:hypothetical protein
MKVIQFLLLVLLMLASLTAEEAVPAGLQAQVKTLEEIFQKMKSGDFSSATLALSQMTSLTKEERDNLTSNLQAKSLESEKIFGKFRFFKIVDVQVKYNYLARVRLLEFYERNGYIWNINFIFNGDEWHLTSFEWTQPSKAWAQGSE